MKNNISNEHMALSLIIVLLGLLAGNHYSNKNERDNSVVEEPTRIESELEISKIENINEDTISTNLAVSENSVISENDESFKVDEIRVLLFDNTYYLFRLIMSEGVKDNYHIKCENIFDDRITFEEFSSNVGKTVILYLDNVEYVCIFDGYKYCGTDKFDELGYCEILTNPITIYNLQDFGYDNNTSITLNELLKLQNELNGNQSLAYTN